MQNGRVKGEAKRALRAVIERYEIPVAITANQNLILRNIAPSWREDIASTLRVSEGWGGWGVGVRSAGREQRGAAERRAHLPTHPLAPALGPPPPPPPPPQAAGVRDASEWDPIESLSMACPALPLCGLAISEAERALPAINERVRALATAVGLPEDESFVVRMTGEGSCGGWGWG